RSVHRAGNHGHAVDDGAADGRRARVGRRARRTCGRRSGPPDLHAGAAGRSRARGARVAGRTGLPRGGQRHVGRARCRLAARLAAGQPTGDAGDADPGRARAFGAPAGDRRAGQRAAGERTMRAPLFAALAAAAFTLVPLAPALSQPGGAFHGPAVDLRPRVNLDASAWREVVQDRVVVVLYAERESPEPADGQAQVSRMLAPALERLKTTPEVEVESAGFRTDPVWQQSRVVGWRTRGALKLTSKPSEAFNALVGELATSLNVQSVSYHLSR